ncbi:hypothetical protein Tco_0951440 [Tanacetum coccineum]|uniref:Uncharacterized protein n=1 Tax=Tanacetum coccineum TaxID=301880 RepID=A0ABQ5DU53_9ASTR
MKKATRKCGGDFAWDHSSQVAQRCHIKDCQASGNACDYLLYEASASAALALEAYYSLLETSSDSHSDTSSDSSSRHSSSDHLISDSPCDSPTATSVGPSRKRRRSPTTSVPVALPVPGALCLVRADLLPPRKRISFADDIAARGTYVRVEDGTATEEEAESSTRGTIKIKVDRVTHHVVLDDTAEPVREDFPELVSANGSLSRVYCESVQRDQGHRIVATSQQSADMSERIGTLEQDNMRFRGMSGVERQNVELS